MTMSARIQEYILKLLSDDNNHTVQEMKNYLSECGVKGYTDGHLSGSINTLVRNGSIRKMDRGLYSIKKRREDMRKCFVICPLGAEDSETRKNADKLLKHIIRPVCEACDFEAIRVDQGIDANSITQTIIEHLENADLVIADLSEHNPNVFYEMGYRAKSKRPMIHLKKKGEMIPFDVNTIRTLDYDLTDIDSVEELKDRLKKTVESFTYTDTDEIIEEVAPVEQSLSAVVPVLYQILDAVHEVKSDVNGVYSNVINAMMNNLHPAQPQMPPDAALQMQLMNGFLQNPDGFMKLYELTEKINAKGKK